MITHTLRHAVAAWRQYTQARAPKRQAQQDANLFLNGLRKKRLFIRMLAAGRLRLDLQTAARVRIVKSMMKRVVYAWRVRITARKASSGQRRLASKIHELTMTAHALSVWKTLVDRNVRLKRLALSEPVSGLGSSRPANRSRKIAKDLAEAILTSQRRVAELRIGLKLQSPRGGFRRQKAASPKEKAHKRYLEMQKRFKSDIESTPAPGPGVTVEWGQEAVAMYRDMKAAMQSIWQQAGDRLSPWYVFSLWKAFVGKKKAKRMIAFEHIKKAARNWLWAVAKHTRNVERIMDEVGIFAEIHIKKRTIRQWKEAIAKKYADIEQQRRRKIVKKCFRGLRKYCYLRKKKTSLKMKAVSHYGYNMICKALFSLCKSQRERRISKGFRVKSLLKSSLRVWIRKFQAYRLFQNIQARPLRGGSEISALWLWWQSTFSLKHTTRPLLLKALKYKWTRKGVLTLRSWHLVAKKAEGLRNTCKDCTALAYRRGLNALEENLRECHETEVAGKSAFRAVRLICSFRFWAKMLSLRKRKRFLVQKRLFSAWKSARKAQISLFSGYRRSVLLRQAWSRFKVLVVLRSKYEAATAWRDSLTVHHRSSKLKLAVVTLLRNVYQRKAVRRLINKAAKYEGKVRARKVMDGWKCFHFREKRKKGVRRHAEERSMERLVSARYGPNEGRMVMRTVFTAWKVIVHHALTIDSVIATRASRRKRTRAKAILKAWKLVCLHAVQDGIRELASLGGPAVETPKRAARRSLLLKDSAAVKSEVEEEIDQLERSIKATLSAMSFASSPRR